MHSIKKDNKWI